MEAVVEIATSAAGNESSGVWSIPADAALALFVAAAGAAALWSFHAMCQRALRFYIFELNDFESQRQTAALVRELDRG